MEITRVRIDWPDGATSWLEPPAPGATYTVTRQ
jgi:hypothetical protein